MHWLMKTMCTNRFHKSHAFANWFLSSNVAAHISRTRPVFACVPAKFPAVTMATIWQCMLKFVNELSPTTVIRGTAHMAVGPPCVLSSFPPKLNGHFFPNYQYMGRSDSYCFWSFVSSEVVIAVIWEIFSHIWPCQNGISLIQTTSVMLCAINYANDVVAVRIW